MDKELFCLMIDEVKKARIADYAFDRALGELGIDITNIDSPYCEAFVNTLKGYYSNYQIDFILEYLWQKEGEHIKCSVDGQHYDISTSSELYDYLEVFNKYGYI